MSTHVVTAPFFLSAFGDDPERVTRFHGRLIRDAVAATPASSSTPSASQDVIDGVSVAVVLDRLRGGDSAALTALYNTFFETLWRVAALYTHSAESAGDIVHDVFLRLWMQRETLESVTDLRVYLTAAVRNRARDLGKHASVVESTQRDGGNAEASGIALPVPPTDAVVEREEFLAAYRHALTLLSESERTAALLRWEEGFTLEQVAEVLSMSVMGARGVIRRAQHKVQEALQHFR